MSWVKIDDAMPWHPRMLGVPARGIGALTLALCYSSKYLTDGLVPYAALPMLRLTDDDFESLLDAGMVSREEGGYQILGYLDYQPSAASVRERREVDAERRRKGREARTKATRQEAAQVKPARRPKSARAVSEECPPGHRSDISRSPKNVRAESEECPGGVRSSRPGPARPVELLPPPSGGGSSYAAAAITSDRLDHVTPLINELSAAKLIARWDRIADDDLAEVEQLITRHGTRRLVKAAQSAAIPDRPAVFAQAWLGTWRALPDPNVRPIRGRCDDHAEELPCRACAADRLVAG